MALYNANVPDYIKPDQYHELILHGLQTESIAAASGVAVVNTDAATMHFPRITGDTTAVWALEGEDLEVGNPTLDEVTSTPKKVGGVIKVSRELAQDSSPAATKLVGDSLTRAVAVALDEAFFTNAGAIAKAPLGLPAVAGITTVAGDAADLDAFTEAQIKTLSARQQIRAWYMNAATYLRFAGIKQATGSNVGLLQSQFQINGLPVHITEDLTDNVVYGLDTSSGAFLVVRDRAKVETSTDAYFSTDEVAVKVTMRLDFAFPAPKAVARIDVAV